MDWLDLKLNQLVEKVVRRSKLEGTPTERTKILFYIIQYSLWLLVPLASFPIFYMIGKTPSNTELLAIVAFVSNVLILLPLLLYFMGFNAAMYLALIGSIIGPYIFGMQEENSLYVFHYFLVVPTTLQYFVSINKKTVTILLLGLAFGVKHILNMHQYGKEHCILGGDSHMSVFYLIALDLPYTITNYIISCLQIRQRNTLKRKLIQMNIENQTMSKAKEYFYGCVSHELRNPLNVLMNSIEVLLRKNKNNEHLQICKVCTASLIYQISNILDLSQIQNKTLRVNYDTISFNEIMDDLFPNLKLLVEGTDIQFQLISKTKIPEYLFIDENRLKQIIFNLVSNAVSFTQKGNIYIILDWHEPLTKDLPQYLENILSISNRMNLLEGVDEFIPMEEYKREDRRINSMLMTRAFIQDINETYKPNKNKFRPTPRKSSKRLKAKTQEKKNLVHSSTETAQEIVVEKIDQEGILQIEIVDSGCGVTEERLLELNTRIPFNFGLHSSVGGSGIGFWISQEVVQLMRGGIRVESEEGIGCSVNLAIPVIIPSYDQIIGSQNSKEFDWSGIKILYVEDQIFNQNIIKKILQSEGLTVDLADNGLQGFMKYHINQKIDIILTDLRMPVMEGVEMIIKIREFEKRRNKKPVPIIVLSGDPSDTEQERCLKAGANIFINKPAPRKTLMDSLFKALLIAQDI